jgi:type II secretory pathway component PulC
MRILLNTLIIFTFLFFIGYFMSYSLSPKGKVFKPEEKTKNSMNLQDCATLSKNNHTSFLEVNQTILNSEIFLKGTVLGAKKTTYAIIADKAGRQHIFRIGDSVFGIGILKKVRENRIFLNINGKEIEIHLTKKIITGEFTSHDTPFNEFESNTADSAYYIDTQIVQQVKMNPYQLMTEGKLSPNIVEGGQQGFVLSDVKLGGIYHS